VAVFQDNTQGLAVYRSASANLPLQVVLVHGAVDRAAGMIRVARKIDNCEVVRYDRRGYGRSASLGAPFTFEEHIEDLELVIGDRPSVLFGHSYGGSIALAVASRGNSFVHAAVSYEAPRTWETWWPPPPGTDIDPADAAEHFVKRMIGQERWQTLPASSRLNLRRQGVLMVHELNTQKIQRYRVEEAEVPLILGVGDFSGEHAQKAATIFSEEAKRGRVVRLLGAKHDAPMSHPEQIAGLIGAAVRQISKLL